MTHILNSLALNSFLAQVENPFREIGSSLGLDLGSSLLNLLKAVIILVVGWIIAGIVKKIVKSVLNATDIDNRIAAWVTGQRGGDSFPIEEWIASLIFWLIMLFVIVACLKALELETVSEPLNSLLNQITSFIPQLIGAAILIGVAWVVATLVKTIVTRALSAFNLDSKINGSTGDSSNLALSDTIGNALYWFVFLLFLPSILSTLELDGTLNPVQGMLDELLAILPNILAAVILGFVGWFVSKIVGRLVTNLLAATGVDRIGERFGLRATGGQKPLSGIIGTIVFVLILIPFAISALEALQIESISDPATDMLNQVFDFIPKLFAAGLVLAFFYAAGKFVADLISDVLTSIGFNNFLDWLGVSRPASTTPTPDIPTTTTTTYTTSPLEGLEGSTEQATVLQTDSSKPKTPSEFVGIVALVAIMLVGTLTAVDILNIPALEAVIGVILEIAGQVLIGIIVFGIGLYLANLAYRLILSSGTSQAPILAQAARIAIVILIGAMALNSIGVAPNIVNLAFGLVLGGIAVAIALAFGLGGREVAKESLRSWVNSFKNQ